MIEKNSLSIAIPTYNGDKFLKKQLQRLFHDCDKKKFINFYEIVILDNGSTDNTKKIVKYFKKKNENHKIFKIRYIRKRRNVGFRNNFISIKKYINGKYVLFLSDDDLPPAGFYKKLFDLIKENNSKEMLILSHKNSNKYYRALFGVNDVSYIINRGSILSGIIIRSNQFNYKNYLKSLYPQTELYLDYYLSHGMRQIDIKPAIKNLDNQSILKRFDANDRMKRKSDYAILGKVEIIEKFHNEKKISFFQFIYAFYSIYKKALHIKMILNVNNKTDIEKHFFKSILEIRRKKLVKFILFLIYLRKFFK